MEKLREGKGGVRYWIDGCSTRQAERQIKGMPDKFVNIEQQQTLGNFRVLGLPRK